MPLHVVTWLEHACAASSKKHGPFACVLVVGCESERLLCL